MKLLPAPIAITALSEFSPPSMLLLAMLRERLRRLEEATLVAHVPPSVVQAAIDNSLSSLLVIVDYEI